MAIKQLSNAKREMIFSELHSLLTSGLDFSAAFSLLIQSEEKEEPKRLLNDIYNAVINGNTLHAAFEKSGRFSALDCGVIKIGEQTGKLSDSLLFLADYYRAAIAQRRMVVGAVSYPIIIIAVAMIVMIFMMAVIVPMFEQVYARMGGTMPGVTQWIISISRHFHLYLIIVVLVIISTVAFLKIYGRKESVEKTVANIILRTPMLGTLIKKSIQARFCKLLYLLYGSGVPLLSGVEMLSGIITFQPYRTSFYDICRGLNRGESMSDVMGNYATIYDRKLVVLIRVGEQTNRLGQMLHKQSEDITLELEHRLKQIGSTLEPILIMIVGAIVAVILVAMYMPMFKMGNVIN